MGVLYHHSTLPTSFASCSIIGDQALVHKMIAIREAGFDGMELAMPDILSYGRSLTGTMPSETDFDSLVDFAVKIGNIASELGLKIVMLQPFSNFEGWPAGSPMREDAFMRARGWIRVMEACGTDMLQVGSSDSKGITPDFDELASDLAELADMCNEKRFYVAYENWAWATYASTWKSVWQIIQKADRPNLGLCLDTFQSVGGEWGDPSTQSGLIESISKSQLSARWHASLKELTRLVPPNKIYVLQISDAYRMDPPMHHEADRNGNRSRSRWSHAYRPLPCTDGYLPVHEFMEAVLDTGFRGWLSVEVFDSKNQKPPKAYTQEGMTSLKNLLSLI